MHPFSSLLSYYTALVESNLMEVEKWSVRIGINTHFSNGYCSVCQFFEDSLMSDEECKVPLELAGFHTCTCVTDGNDDSVTCKCLDPDSCECANVNDRPGITPLHIACSRTDVQVIRFLLERRAAVNAVTFRQLLTPLQVAFGTQSLESLTDICTALVSYGCHVHGDSVSPLHSAVDQNSPSTVAALLSARLEFPDTVRQALAKLDNRTGYAPLHTAVRYGYLECAQLLIDAGADVNALCRDVFGECVATPPLELAVLTRNKDAVRLLLQSPSCQVDKTGSRKATALLHAIARGNADIVEALLAAGASTEVYNEDDLTPLVMAVLTSRNDITMMLINSGANVNSLADHKYSALHHAAWCGNIEVVRLLLDNGARNDDRTDDGNTPLALAAHGGSDDILELLISRGCCVNNSDKDEDTPLLYTVHNGDIEGCKLLLDNGASCSVRNRAKMTTTWAAAYCGHRDVLRYLIVHGNPPLSVLSRGLVFEHDGPLPPFIYDVAHTPLFVAIDRKNFGVAELLLDAGVMMCEEHWCWSSSLVSNMNDGPPQQLLLHSRLVKAMSEVPSLLQIVRHSLRRHFGQRILTVVPVLEIPQTLKDYLALRSLEQHRGVR